MLTATKKKKKGRKRESEYICAWFQFSGDNGQECPKRVNDPKKTETIFRTQETTVQQFQSKASKKKTIKINFHKVFNSFSSLVEKQLFAIAVWQFVGKCSMEYRSVFTLKVHTLPFYTEVFQAIILLNAQIVLSEREEVARVEKMKEAYKSGLQKYGYSNEVILQCAATFISVLLKHIAPHMHAIHCTP